MPGQKTARVDLTGLRIDKVSAKVRAAMWDALAVGADNVAATASNLAPQDTGKLSRSIVSSRIGKFKLPAVFTTTGYGGHVETGTSDQPPQPFIRPALASNVGHIGDLVARAVKGIR